jgi:hypothetical protein
MGVCDGIRSPSLGLKEKTMPSLNFDGSSMMATRA